ncbi:MAG: hypothetical protein PVI86_19985, partial [Phycisphaerae bacterium]
MHRCNTGLTGMVLVVGIVCSACATEAVAGDPGWINNTNLSLGLSNGMTAQGQDESATAATMAMSTGWTLDGPYFLRSADPIEVGEIELKFIYGYEKEEDDEEHEVEFELEWGVMENVEFIFAVAAEVGEGKVEGNGDIEEIGFHIKHWEEDGWLPAFATRHLVRIPTGYRSDGVDYLARGLFTSTLIPDKLRLHFNPWAKSINGNREDNERHFRCGAAIGIDYRVNEDLIVIADYQANSSEVFGESYQHAIEFGADWEFAEKNL